MPLLGWYGQSYEASNLGRIRRRATGRVLAASFSGADYLQVTLSACNVQTTVRVHRAVLSAFCGPEPFENAEAAHNDGNRANCRLDNLRWATSKENAADVSRHGRRAMGSDVFGAVLDEEEVAAILRRVANGERNRPIAEDYGVSISTIHLIRHGRTWKHVQGGKP